MRCYVYKGSQKADHFLYLTEQLDSDKLPEQVPSGLFEMLGDLDFIVEFDLDESRKLPNADAKQILLALEERGFYFQVPNKSVFDVEEQYFN